MVISIISGTNRPGSNTRKIAGILEGHFAAHGTPADVIDLLELPAGIFEPGAYAEKPVAFQSDFADQVLKSDGLVVVTPEYNGSMPGVLKMFIDMLPFPESFEGRPVAFVGLAAGMWGGLRSVEQLQAIFAYRNAHIFPERVFIPGVGKVLNPETGVIDPGIDGRLKSLAGGFLKFAGQVG